MALILELAMGRTTASTSFRSKGRLPILSYYNKKTKCALVRCAQPMVGATGRRSESDEFLIRAVRNASPNPALLVIFDARSSLAEMGNKIMGKGSEIGRNYINTKVCAHGFCKNTCLPCPILLCCGNACLLCPILLCCAVQYM